MKIFQLRILFCLSLSFAALLFTSCDSTRPTHMGTFIQDGSRLIELKREQTHGAPNPDDLLDSPSITNRQPTIIFWQQDTDPQYLALVSTDPYYEYPINITQSVNGSIEIKPIELLNQRILHCVVQTDPAGSASIWCFNVM